MHLKNPLENYINILTFITDIPRKFSTLNVDCLSIFLSKITLTWEFLNEQNHPIKSDQSYINPERLIHLSLVQGK